jgi:hypothetical protein
MCHDRAAGVQERRARGRLGGAQGGRLGAPDAASRSRPDALFASELTLAGTPASMCSGGPFGGALMSSPYSYAYACLSCRRSFKRPGGPGAPDLRPCPRCRGDAVNLGRNFRAPAVDDLTQWRKVGFLVRHGFVFQTLYDPETGTRIGYPRTLEAARSFVRKYRHLALPTSNGSSAQPRRRPSSGSS